MDTRSKSALRTIEEAFGDRLNRETPHEGRREQGALVSVLPRSVEGVEFLAGVAERFSVPLVAPGAGTVGGPGAEEGGILVRFEASHQKHPEKALRGPVSRHPCAGVIARLRGT